MFIWLNKQGVRSDSGFEAQFTGRFDAEYREDGQVVKFYVEDGITGGVDSIIINPSAFTHWDNGNPISLEKQEQIFQNLKNAMKFQGLLLAENHGERPT